MFFRPGSEYELNLPSRLVFDIRKRIERKQYHCEFSFSWEVADCVDSVIEEATEEILKSLYQNNFLRYVQVS